MVRGGVKRRDAHVLLEPRQVEAQLDAARGVEASHRVVEQEEPRLHDERPRDGDPARRRPRELVGPPCLRAGQTDLLERGPHAAAPLGVADAAAGEAEGHVVAHRQVRPERAARRHQPDATPLRRQVVDGLVVHQDPPDVGSEEPGHQGDERARAAPRRAKQRVDLSGADGDRHVGHRPPAAGALADTLHPHLGQTHDAPTGHARPGASGRARPRSTTGSTASPIAASTT